MTIKKRYLCLLISSLLTSSTLIAKEGNLHQQAPADGITDSSRLQPVKKLKASAPLIAPITIPAPTDEQRLRSSINKITDADAIEAGCHDYTEFAALTGNALFNFIQNTSAECISELYRRNDDTAVTVYQADKVIDIAQRAKNIAETYDSASNDGMYKLFYFLRGAFYVEHNSSQLTYKDQRVNKAMLALLETYSRNPHFSDITPTQGDTMTEYFTAWDSSKNYMQSSRSITRYLNDFSPEHLAEWSHRGALTKALTTLYRAGWDAAYTKAAEDHSALRAALLKVANSEYIYNSEYNYQASDALKEYARFLEYQQYWGLSEALKTEINKGIVDFMSRFERNTKLWIKAAGSLETYNPGQCEQFNICGWKEQLKKQVLSIHYTCSDTIKINAQDMTQSELQQSCEQISEEESLFHKLLNTGNQPVNDDLNRDLEINIFNSGDDYKSYAGTLFGISTDNGGMYLEGDPSVEGNQARFIAHEATWLDDILVWNLRHEYIHYLDARFNMYGPFNYFKTNFDKVVWWSEGLAEYISHQNRYDEAVEIGQQRRYKLSEIFNNNYSSGEERVYRWGYLAVRFLFEMSPESVTELMQYGREGDVDGWVNYINTSIGTSLDYSWDNWLQTVQSDDSKLGTNNGSILVPDSCKVQGPLADGQIYNNRAVCINNDQAYYYFYVDTDVTRIDINSAHGDGNVDLFYSPSSWAQSTQYLLKSTEPGNTESITIHNPAAGWQYITAQSEPSSSGASLKINMSKDKRGEIIPDTCKTNEPSVDGQIYNNQTICINNGKAYYYFYVDNDITRININSAHGDGNVDLFYSPSGWAQSSQYLLKSTGPGNTESITISNPAGGWQYITAESEASSSGASLKVEMIK
ncbi:M9 family metallopeptidase [Psychromonas aquimarina]|uniref:M9 family metallopeptidase n=1 Tax=Psychromonas aquimarina TaxID=444919 RepID=UPI0003FF11DD|nr:M9 family metallopeptidase [Psychromonas aquimarina]